MEIKTKRTIAALLAIAGAFGTLATAFLTRNAAKKEIEVQAKLQTEKKPGEELSKKQILKAYAPLYITPGSGRGCNGSLYRKLYRVK